MGSRPLSDSEAANLKIVRDAAKDFALLFVTETGLSKSILDATLPVRTLLREEHLHDYDGQPQGKSNKVLLQGSIVEDERLILKEVSVYRPSTKKGDPRLWPSQFKDHAAPGDVIVVFFAKGRLSFLNLSRSSVAADKSRGKQTVASRFFEELQQKRTGVAAELLSKLQDIARGDPLAAVCAGPTAIGRSVEAALGIQANSRKTPDFRGIELKAFRSTKAKQGLITLFSKTPDWNRSILRGSKDFLSRFGYERNGRRQLYCSVYAVKKNSQGLRLRINLAASDLEEFHASGSEQALAVWSLDSLHSDFRRKHHETFWISADSEIRAGREYFRLRSVTHTQQPIVPQFDALLLSGDICLDHTIKSTQQGVSDHGYLFRVTQERFVDLFAGEPRSHIL